MDVVLLKTVDPEELLERLVEVLPTGLGAITAEEVGLRSPSLMSLVEGFRYTLRSTHADVATTRDRIAELMGQEEVMVERRKPRKGRRPPKTKRFNIRPMISELALEDTSSVEVSFVTTRNDDRLAKWREVAELIGLDPQSVRVMKHQTHLRSLGKEATNV